MWLFLNNAYLSVVADRDKPSHLLVRARFKGDLEAVFGEIAVQETPAADYRFRARIPRNAVADLLAAAVLGITATNFKASVKDGWRHDLYLRVWSLLREAQQQRAPKPRKRDKIARMG
jgi:hypothetical protein